MTFAFVGHNAFLQSSAPGVSGATHGFASGHDAQSAARSDPVLMATQRQLAEIGLYEGEIDGLGGPKTRSALENWQKLQQYLEKGKQPLTSGGDLPRDEDALARIIRDDAAE